MTKRSDIGDNDANDLSGGAAAGIDPRLVELVRFMARAAAEYDYEALIEAGEHKDEILSGKRDLP